MNDRLDKAIEWVKSFFFDYLTLREYDNVISYFADDITWFGTGIGEICHSKREALQMMKDDLEQMLDPMNMHDNWFNSYQLSSDTYVVWGCFSASTNTGVDHEITFDGVRVTAICTMNDNGWAVRHFHASLASSGQEEGEYYPLKEVEAQNQRLQQLVAQKTLEIQEQKQQLELANYRIKKINAELIAANEQLGVLNDILRKQASTDLLTSTLNRYYIINRLEYELNQLESVWRPFCIMMLDLDNFKGANDQYGHLNGDRVLEEIASVLKSNLRRNDLVGRYGGDEFLIILPNTELEEAVSIAERIRKAVGDSTYTEHLITITTSIGIAQYRSGYSAEDFINLADRRLYMAKATGRDKVIAFSD